MEIKQKHGKHALRKAVTAAVLAGTAFSSLGGFAGAVTTVKADEEKVSDFIFDISNKRNLNKLRNNNGDKELLAEIREKLNDMSVEDLQRLLRFFDPEDLNHDLLPIYNKMIEKFEEDGTEGVSLAFSTLVVNEIQKRIREHEELGKKILEKTSELEQMRGAEEKVKKEKEEVEAKLEEQSYELLKKEEELKRKKRHMKKLKKN